MSAEKFVPGQTVYRVFHLWSHRIGGHVSRGLVVTDSGMVQCGKDLYPCDGWHASEVEAQADWAPDMESHAHALLAFVAKVRRGAAEAAGQPPQAGFLREKPLAEGGGKCRRTVKERSDDPRTRKAHRRQDRRV
jgi:hypothetical protein